jgi:predicted transcriptional regulator
MSYEFNNQEELLIKRVSNKGVAIAIIIFLVSLVDLIFIFIDDMSYSTIESRIYSIQDLLQIGVGLAFLLPFRNFKNVVKTSGNDIEEMIDGMGKMIIGFKIMIVCLILTFIVGIIGIIL